MTFIIAANLGDFIIVAADKRSMYLNTRIHKLRIAFENNQKMYTWALGVVTGTGEVVLLNRIFQVFIDYHGGEFFDVFQVIKDALIYRISEGISPKVLLNNAIMFTAFDGETTHFYNIHFEQYFTNEYTLADDVFINASRLEPKAIYTSQFLEPDPDNIWDFFHKLKPRSLFSSDFLFIEYYKHYLRTVLARHSAIDFSITTNFDLFLQDCTTGRFTMIPVSNDAEPQYFLERMDPRIRLQ